MPLSGKPAIDITTKSGRKHLVLKIALLFSAAALILLIISGNVWAQTADKPAALINYAYSSWVATGYYKVGDKRVWILRGPFAYTIREPEHKKWGIELLFPVTIGFYDFSGNIEDVGAVTFVPGVQLSYPAAKNWWVKPFGQFGLGKDFSGGDVAYIFGAGLKSLATFPFKGFELDLGNALTWADNSQSGGDIDQGFSLFEIGLNTRWPLDLIVLDRKTNLNFFFVYSEFFNSLTFDLKDVLPIEQLGESNISINRLFKFGIALGAEGSFSILGFKFRGGGVDVTFGDDYFGIGLNTGFPF